MRDAAFGNSLQEPRAQVYSSLAARVLDAADVAGIVLPSAFVEHLTAELTDGVMQLVDGAPRLPLNAREDLSGKDFNELVDEAAGGLLVGIGRGDRWRALVYDVCARAAVWRYDKFVAEQVAKEKP